MSTSAENSRYKASQTTAWLLPKGMRATIVPSCRTAFRLSLSQPDEVFGHYGQMVPLHHIAHRAWIQRVAQLEQFTVDLVKAQPGILSRQPNNERFQLSIQSRPSAFAGLAEAPLATHQLPMPLLHRLGLDQHQTGA